MNDDIIEKIQQEIKQLSQKQVELEKIYQQRVKSYEEQKTLYQHLFGQPPLQPDPELQAVRDQIVRLKSDEDNYFDIFMAAASIPPRVPEKDWSNIPFYSKHLAKLGLVTPAEQIYTVFGGTVAFSYAGSNFYSAHNLFKITQLMSGTEQWVQHLARVHEVTPEQIKLIYSYWICRLRFTGFATALGAPTLLVVYLWSKRKQ